ncbi:MtrAB system histidine kinase MtrB [Tessaracoccus sp. MC1756]|uniref:MtrAB system histidine kinase MtrB n=1 Tax=Tessaracoccus sp. MC1756 TaxID=2760311 RepID=UPI0021083A48|nr:MtrAB system histidine kinase MtrB [Tessaracoccus sp. MC1756]
MPLRVLISTLGLSMALMTLAGVVLMRQATAGVVETKRQAALNEASGVYAFMQEQLRTPEARGAAIHESLSRLADLADAQAAQYRVVIQGPVSSLTSTGIRAESVPVELRNRVEQDQGMFITPTRVVFTDPTMQPEPGWAIGAALIGETGERYPVFYIFPMTTELQTLSALQGAVIAAGVALVAALGLISYLVTVQVVRPVRKASTTALQLASGQLGERMLVRGTDDLAVLATSMNRMAAELQQRIRELETLSTLQQRFVSDVSHELRTPMTTIKMAADVLHDARSNFDHITARSAELMSLEIDRFDLMLADLLEISRFDAGAAVLALDETDVASLVAAEVAGSRSMAGALGVELRFEQVDEGTTAEVDTRRVRRILRNLITNAIEHGEGRPVVIRVASDHDAVAVTVRDYGVGFKAEDAARVFDRFWRADPSRTRLVGGTGLGLAIAMEDARLHRGWLTAWGRPGRGAQFRLTLPRESGHELTSSPLAVVPADDKEVSA